METFIGSVAMISRSLDSTALPIPTAKVGILDCLRSADVDFKLLTASRGIFPLTLKQHKDIFHTRVIALRNVIVIGTLDSQIVSTASSHQVLNIMQTLNQVANRILSMNVDYLACIYHVAVWNYFNASENCYIQSSDNTLY